MVQGRCCRHTSSLSMCRKRGSTPQRRLNFMPSHCRPNFFAASPKPIKLKQSNVSWAKKMGHAGFFLDNFRATDVIGLNLAQWKLCEQLNRRQQITSLCTKTQLQGFCVVASRSTTEPWIYAETQSCKPFNCRKMTSSNSFLNTRHSPLYISVLSPTSLRIVYPILIYT